MLTSPGFLLTLAAAVLAGSLIWHFGPPLARRWRIPFPAAAGWVLEMGLREWWTPTPLITRRMGVRPGMRVLEIGPGIGYLTVPVARQLGDAGRLVALELQSVMARRTRERAAAAGLRNVEVRVGDVTSAPLESDAYDLAFMVTVLGEIPDRDAAIARVRNALKSGGTLSITEVFGDPDYQRYADVERRCLAAGLKSVGREGSWLRYTANFRRQ